MPETSRYRIPLLRDRHSHPLFYAACMDGLNIRNVASKAEAIARLRAEHDTPQGRQVLIVCGWVDSVFDFTPEDLAGLPPTIIFNLSIHGLKLNDGARQLLQKRYGSEIEQWGDQAWFERNLRRVLNCVANLNASVERLQEFYARLREVDHVGYAEEMLLVDERELFIFKDAGLLERTRFWASPDLYEQLSPVAREMVHGLKLFTDGAFGMRTAAVHAVYDDGQSGFLTYDDDSLQAELARCLAHGKSMAIHAIGDRAIDQVVAGLEQQQGRLGEAPEIRMEHAQLMSKSVAQRAKDLGLKLCMQPNFSPDSEVYRDRLAEPYLAANNPLRMLIDEVGFVPGQDLIFGSDGMPHGAEEALRCSLFPSRSGQRLTLEEFVAGYCLPDESLGSIDIEISKDNVRIGKGRGTADKR